MPLRLFFQRRGTDFGYLDEPTTLESLLPELIPDLVSLLREPSDDCNLKMEETEGKAGKPTNADYAVGWICALPIELAAARLMFDEEHTGLSVAAGDTNTYSLGGVAHHFVVMTCLPQGTMGTNAAAAAVIDMSRTFPRLRFILMVGIGGGVPDPTNSDPYSDVRLGDVVVSKPNGKYGGVVQYDFGKTQQSGTFQRVGTLNKPPPVLRSAVATLEAKHLIDDSALPEYIDSVFRVRPRVKNKFGHPGNDQDLLFEADYLHDPTNETSCSDCSRQYLVQRALRDSTIPVIHYGLIASGNQVMKDALTREQIRKELEVLCFEMEAAGLMDNCPCLVIRGICDYADSHKNKQWQPYAALTAAAYAKELLHTVDSSSVRNEGIIQLVSDTKAHELLREIKTTNVEILKATNEATERREELFKNQIDSEKAEKLFELLSISSDHETMKNNNPKRAPGTCVWFLDHSQFKKWNENSQNDLLWVSADPGCGKSVLTRSLIDLDLQQTHSTLVCYYFFKDNGQHNSLNKAFCSILHQLFTHNPELMVNAFESMRHFGNGLNLRAESLWNILIRCSETMRTHNIICIFDALDECIQADQETFIEKLGSFYNFHRHGNNHGKNIKFLVTSRPYDHIRSEFQKVITALPTIRLRGEKENEQIQKEIDVVIEYETDILAKELQFSDAAKQRLLRSLRSMKHRTYLWLYLAKDSLRRSCFSSLRPNEESIDMLPTNVEDAYDKILNKVDEKNQLTARRILKIIVGAYRPLTISEMAISLQLVSGSQAAVDSEHLKRNIREWCQLFIFFNDDRIFLIHQTAKEYLLMNEEIGNIPDGMWKHTFDIAEAEALMAVISTNYLLNIHRQYEQANDDSFEGDNFWQYAALNWPEHARISDALTTNEQHQVMYELLNPDSFGFRNWITKWSEQWSALPPVSIMASRTSPLIVSAGFGLHSLCTYILKVAKKSNPGYTNELGYNALNIAIMRRHESVVEFFLTKKQVRPNESNHKGITPLIYAGICDFPSAAEMLMKRKDVDINKADHDGWTPLIYAASSGSVEIVEMLLARHDLDFHKKNDFGDTPLGLAAQSGHREVVELLLARPDIDVNKVDLEHGRTALAWAAEADRRDVVELLLARDDVNVNKADTRGLTPQGIAVEMSNHAVAEIIAAKSNQSLTGEFQLESTLDDTDVESQFSSQVPTGSTTSEQPSVWFAGLSREDLSTRFALLRNKDEMSAKFAGVFKQEDVSARFNSAADEFQKSRRKIVGKMKGRFGRPST